MKRSESFLQTRRERPSDAESTGYAYLKQAGYVESIGTGIFQYLPLGTRVVQSIENIMREEMNAVGGQEVRMPVVHPEDLWRESGRWDEFGPELLKFQDRTGSQLALAPTHEETITKMVRNNVQSYRDLPFMLYQIQTKFRDEPRARGGLIRVREFTMKDGYSFHRDAEDLDAYYPDVREAYVRIFRRCGVDPAVISADPGVMGGAESHEFMLPAEIGEDQLVSCSDCDYTMNQETATVSRSYPGPEEKPAEVEEVETPDCQTIQDVAEHLDVPEEKTAKAVFYTEKNSSDGSLIFALIRGDLGIHEAKLEHVVDADELTAAGEGRIRETGAVPGYASPLELSGDVTIVVDTSIPEVPNFVAGANREGYHLRNVNFERDIDADHVADIAEAREGDPCPECEAELETSECIELGHIFKLGTRYSETMDATYQDQDGNTRPIVMGCYGIGPDRLLAAVAESWHDENGLTWPPEVAPYSVTVLPVGSSGTEQNEKAADIYRNLREKGIQTILDDRDKQSGVKFNDAELIGTPLFVIVGPRGLEENTVDLQRRIDGETRKVNLDDDIAAAVQDELENLRNEIRPKPNAEAENDFTP